MKLISLAITTIAITLSSTSYAAPKPSWTGDWIEDTSDYTKAQIIVSDFDGEDIFSSSDLKFKYAEHSYILFELPETPCLKRSMSKDSKKMKLSYNNCKSDVANGKTLICEIYNKDKMSNDSIICSAFGDIKIFRRK
jgi:hypothetical protein